MATWNLILDARQVTSPVYDLVASCVEDHFREGGLSTDEFIDRLCDDYLNAIGVDIEELDTPGVREIMRHARAVRRELG